jgi:hypothetical protein
MILKTYSYMSVQKDDPMGTRVSFPVVKWPGREADHSPPSSAKVKE